MKFIFFLLRIVGLIVGWFAFLFCLELVLRMFLGVVALILNSFRGSVKVREVKIEEQVVEEKVKFPVEIDEISTVKHSFNFI